MNKNIVNPALVGIGVTQPGEITDQSLQLLANALPHIVWVSAPNGDLEYFNHCWLEYTGLTLEETKGWGWKPVIHPDDLQHTIDIWTGALERGETFETEYRFKRASDGEYRWHLGRAVPVTDSKGVIVKWFGTCTDIHDQKVAVGKLQENAAQFERLANSLPQLAWRADETGWIYWYNDRWFEYTGTTPEAMEGWGWQSVHDPERLPFVMEKWQNSIATGQPFEMVFPLKGADGTFRSFLTRVTPVFNTDGKLTNWFGTNTDIKNQKDAEDTALASLRISQDTFRSAMDNAPIGMAIVAPDGKWLKVNNALSHLLGYSEEELMKIDFQTITHPDDLLADMKYVNQMLAKEIPNYSMEKRYFRKDGQIIWILLNVSLVWNVDSTPKYFLAQIQDITERRRTDDERAKLIAIIEDSADYIGMADLDGNLLYHNGSARRMIGLPEDYDLSQLKIHDMHPEWAIKLIKEEAIPAAFEKGSWLGETALLDRNGREIPVLQNFALHRDVSGQPICFTTIIRDISERKKTEVEREKLIEQLAESNTELERFAYVASHDMQEPLRMIANFGSLISAEYSDKLDVEGQEYIRIVSESATRMQNMVDDLLEYARVENNVTRFSPVNVAEELKHVLENLSASIQESDAKITYNGLPEISGNPVQIMRLLQNLIGNGLKYQQLNAKPVINISAEQQDAAWLFAITDNGIGMQEEYTQKIFEPYKRLHTWQEYKGTGIGLAVCKKIVENHGGKIWVTSQVGTGSTFNFTIPIVNDGDI